MPGHRGGWVSPPPPFSSPPIALAFLTDSIMGYFLCRSPISIDQLLKPPPMVASEETKSLVFALSRSKRTRREDASGDLGRAKEESRVPQVEAGEVEGGAAERRSLTTRR
jgi:hypothetical protein